MSDPSINDLLNSHFSKQTTDRIAPPVKAAAKTGIATEPPKKLSKSFQRQIAKTLAPQGKKNKLRKKQLATNAKRRATTANKKAKESMSKRAAPASDAKASSSSKQAKTAALPEMEKDKEGHPFWEISGKRRLQLSEFKGTTMVGVREFYEKDGEALPGKKGISMTVEQFDTIVQLLPHIERELKGRGLEVRRPNYDRVVGDDEKEEEQKEEGDEKDEDEEE